MTISDLINKLDTYKIGQTEKSWKMQNQQINYSNQYITVIRIDSSNKWLPNLEMEKQWGIIFEKKQDFSHLANYLSLTSKYDIKITPVKTGKNAGCYGLRVYGMKKDPDPQIVTDILDFIFK